MTRDARGAACSRRAHTRSRCAVAMDKAGDHVLRVPVGHPACLVASCRDSCLEGSQRGGLLPFCHAKKEEYDTLQYITIQYKTNPLPSNVIALMVRWKPPRNPVSSLPGMNEDSARDHVDHDRNLSVPGKEMDGRPVGGDNAYTEKKKKWPAAPKRGWLSFVAACPREGW